MSAAVESGAGDVPKRRAGQGRDQVAAVGRVGADQQPGAIGAGELGDPVGDELQRRQAVAVLVEQHRAYVGDGLEPPSAGLGLLVEAGVVDGDAGRAGQRGEHGLVLGGELPRALVGHVQVAEDLAADEDRHAEEGGHRRVVPGESGRRRVLAQVGHPQWLRIGDQLAEDALALRQGTHPGVQPLVDAHGDEVRQTPGRPEHPHRAVAGVDEVGGGLRDATQGAAQIQPGGDGQERVEQPLHPLLAARNRRQPVLHLTDQFGQPHSGKQRGPVALLLWPSGRGVRGHVSTLTRARSECSPLHYPGAHRSTGDARLSLDPPARW